MMRRLGMSLVLGMRMSIGSLCLEQILKRLVLDVNGGR